MTFDPPAMNARTPSVDLPKGIWFDVGNIRACGWVALAPGQSPHGRLPMVTYLGGPIDIGHTDRLPLVLAPILAERLAIAWTSTFPGMYSARVLPLVFVEHESCDGHRCLRCAIEHHDGRSGLPGDP